VTLKTRFLTTPFAVAQQIVNSSNFGKFDNIGVVRSVQLRECDNKRANTRTTTQEKKTAKNWTRTTTTVDDEKTPRDKNPKNEKNSALTEECVSRIEHLDLRFGCVVALRPLDANAPGALPASHCVWPENEKSAKRGFWSGCVQSDAVRTGHHPS
jgi:hypothetical protein